MGIDEIIGSRRLAVMGGTFDPIHYGHLLIAEDVRRRFGLSRVLFMPSGNPPHKTHREVSPAEDRYIMTLLATSANPHFMVSRVEIDRPGPSYTIDTIRQLKAQAGDGSQVYWVTGADAVLEIATWHKVEAILDEATLVAAPRPGSDLGQLEETLGAEQASKVTVLDLPLADISSTMIRDKLRAGETVRYLTPRPVIDYIYKRGLYGTGGQGLPPDEPES